jgi:tRNA(Ile)-lysidine synthase
VAIAVAHTRDDQAETILMRLLRGSGSTGLSAMRPRTGDLLRPMLEVSREQVLEHLRGNGLSWREDPTNGDLSMLRNRIRHELVPYLEARFNPNLRPTLGRTAGLLRDEADVLTGLGDELFGAAVRPAADGVALSLSPLRSAPRAVARLAVRRAIGAAGGLRGVSRLHVDAILALASSKNGQPRRLPLPGHREAVFSSRELRLGPRNEAPRRVPVTRPAAALEARP